MFRSLFVTLVLVEVGLPLLLFVLRDRFVFLPSQVPTAEQGMAALRGRAKVELVGVRRDDDRRLAAYDATPPDGADPTDPVVLFLHGNAGNLGLRAPQLEAFVAGTGLRTLMLDYSGYGGNPGRPSEKTAYEDAVAAFDHLVASGVEADRIVLYGESLGAAVAFGLAEHRSPAGIVAQSAFSSLSSMAWEVYPWLPLGSLLARGAFPSASRAAELDVPLLVVHGTEDRIVPFSEGRRLHRAAGAGAELLAIEGAGHNDLFAVAGSGYLERLGERLRSWCGSNSL